MKIRDPKILFLLSILFSGLAGTGFYGHFYFKEKSANRNEEKKSIVVARRYIKPGERLNPSDLEEAMVPAVYRQPFAFQKKSELINAVGKPAFVARIGLMKGEQVTRPHVMEESQQFDLSGFLDPEHLGITMELDSDAAGGGLIRPGDWVSIFSVFDVQPGIETPRADLIENRIQVVAVDGRTMAAMVSQGEKSLSKPLSNEPISVTLSLTPKQAGRVLLARARGRMSLAFQSSIDEPFPEEKGVNLSALRSAGDGAR